MARERSALSKLTLESLSTRALKKAYVLARLCIILEYVIRHRSLSLWMDPSSDNWQRLMRIRQGSYDLPSLLIWSAIVIARCREALHLTNENARSSGIMAATEVASLMRTTTTNDRNNGTIDGSNDDNRMDASDMPENADHMQQKLADWLLAIRSRSF
jgi:hypothetical protein